MITFDLKQLKYLIESNDWVIGAVNYDEDLHFSTYYLRASYTENTGGMYPGYTAHIAFYENFTEYYYLIRNECLANSDSIIKHAIEDPAWLPSILEEIRRRSAILRTVFESDLSPERLSSSSMEELRSLYQRHDEIHRALYQVARIPEALDRGVSNFSEYLRKYLAEITEPHSINDLFVDLTQPVVPSVLARELLNFQEIVQSVINTSAASKIAAFPRRARMLLPPALITQLEHHRDRWRYLEYHGYGRREPTSLGAYVDRLAAQLSEPTLSSMGQQLENRLVKNSAMRAEMFEKLDLDAAHRALFEIYPEIGATKLFRRYEQLRNFFFLDMLLSEVAKRLGIDEWTVRCMLPEELMAAIDGGGGRVGASISNRTQGVAFVRSNGEEYVFPVSTPAPHRRLLDLGTKILRNKKVLKGVVASRGRVVGTCKVIIRADDQVSQFEKGSILVSESTDPDLIRFLSIAGGVLTQQGGVTSHAAIICRELGIPTIIGIDHLLEQLYDGDVVEVDATEGFIRLISTTHAADEYFFESKAGESEAQIGSKAYNLGLLGTLGYPVPQFLLLDFERVKRLFSSSSEAEVRSVIDQVLRRLELKENDEVALRSSAVTEDLKSGSAAGTFTTLLNIPPSGLGEALADFILHNGSDSNGKPYAGSIILQRMLDPTYAGVCLTEDRRVVEGGILIIEIISGTNDRLTGGTASPDRILVDRLTGDIRQETAPDEILTKNNVDVSSLVRTFLSLEAAFGAPVDIEWAFANNVVWILQVRPIANDSR